MTTRLFGRSLIRAETNHLPEIVENFCRLHRQTALFCNVHMLMLATEDRALAEAMDATDFVFADGAPVSWLQRRISHRPASTVTGFSFMLAVCEQASASDRAVGFFGASEETLAGIQNNITRKFPTLKVGYCYSPPFHDGELRSLDLTIDQINRSGIDFLFVGLGCPKQEKWIHAYAPRLNCSLLGVGAGFDWLAGTTSKPPGWMEKSGLGWWFRLVQDPKRMWRRYLIYNTKFVLKSAILLTRKMLRKGGNSPEPE